MRTIAIFAEQRDGKLRQSSVEALQAAKTIAAKEDRLLFVILGHGLNVASRKLAAYDVEEVLVVDHPELAHYNPELYKHVADNIIRELGPDIIMMGHTAVGRDLAPRIAASLQAGMVSDITGIELDGDEVRFIRPIYAGKAFEHKTFAQLPWVITVRANNIPAAVPVEADAKIRTVPYDRPQVLRTIVKSVRQKTAGKKDLSEARVVVSGGRGVKSKEGFRVLEELADALGGAVGASRGACDAGYCDYALQIGQTGKVVTPDLYIACGISGAIQHLAGMNQSKVIVAINTDPDAPIFEIADYGIVGDLFEVVPAITEHIRKLNR